jgi:hypothetical protein
MKINVVTYILEEEKSSSNVSKGNMVTSSPVVRFHIIKSRKLNFRNEVTLDIKKKYDQESWRNKLRKLNQYLKCCTP